MISHSCGYAEGNDGQGNDVGAAPLKERLTRLMDWPYYSPKSPFPFEEAEPRPVGRLVQIQAEDLSLPEIEAAVLQVLARGRSACVDEGCIVAALRSDLKRGAVTKWADRFSRQFGFTWERRRMFGDLLFSLAPPVGPDHAQSEQPS